jgi:hypothetical protein
VVRIMVVERTGVLGVVEAPFAHFLDLLVVFLIVIFLVFLILVLVFHLVLVQIVLKHLALAGHAIEAVRGHLVLLGVLGLHAGMEGDVADRAVSARQAM